MSEYNFSKELSNFHNAVKSSMDVNFEKFNEDFYSKAIEILRNAKNEGKRVHITGLGKPYHVASYMASLISSIGTPCYLLDCVEARHGSLGQVDKGDVVICISYYGVLEELEQTMKCLRKNGAKLIALTGFDTCNVAKLADTHLNVYVEKEGDYLGRPPRTSMLSTMLALMDISLALQCDNEMDVEKYLTFHPGGKLGEK